jgi:hypothetical protein
MRRKTCLAVLFALLAAPAFARVVEWAMPSFLSRFGATAEAVVEDFSSFEISCTLFLLQ